jgi:hypothetical protein
MVKYMNLDWAVAIGVFVLFVGWSFVYYTGFFTETVDISQGLDSLTERVVESLEAAEYSMPVSHDSPEAGQGILYADMLLPGVGEDQMRVLDSGGGELDCMLSGDRLYWEASLEAGENMFEIVYAEMDVGGCGDSFGTTGANQTFPLSAVKSTKLSQAILQGLQLTDYQEFRESLGIRNNIRLEWGGNLQGSYGPEPPGNRDVFVREVSRPVLEFPGTVDIRVLAWE